MILDEIWPENEDQTHAWAISLRAGVRLNILLVVLGMRRIGTNSWYL